MLQPGPAKHSYQGPRQTSESVEKKRPQPAEAAAAANPNQLMLQIHEKIQSTDPDYVNPISTDLRKSIETYPVEAKSSDAGSSSSSSRPLRPLPIAALMEDVNPIAVAEGDQQEGEDDEGGGEDEGCILTQLVSDLYSSQILYDISKQESFF